MDLKTGYPEQNQDLKTGYPEQNQDLKTGYPEQNVNLKTGYPEQNRDLRDRYPLILFLSKSWFIMIGSLQEDIEKTSQIISSLIKQLNIRKS